MLFCNCRLFAMLCACKLCLEGALDQYLCMYLARMCTQLVYSCMLYFVRHSDFKAISVEVAKKCMQSANCKTVSAIIGGCKYGGNKSGILQSFSVDSQYGRAFRFPFTLHQFNVTVLLLLFLVGANKTGAKCFTGQYKGCNEINTFELRIVAFLAEGKMRCTFKIDILNKLSHEIPHAEFIKFRICAIINEIM